MNLYTYEDINKRDMETSRYKLLRFLDNELKAEIDYHPNLISNEINNKILADSFQYNEKNCSLFLHKKTNDYYVLINFSYLKPQVDEKFIKNSMNKNLKDYKQNIEQKSMFLKSLGYYDNTDIKEASKF